MLRERTYTSRNRRPDGIYHPLPLCDLLEWDSALFRYRIASYRPARCIRRRYRRTCRTGRREGERSMRPVAVVMIHEDVEDARQMLVVQNQQTVKTL